MHNKNDLMRIMHESVRSALENEEFQDAMVVKALLRNGADVEDVKSLGYDDEDIDAANSI
jgi:hypothetical protein